MNNRNWCNYFNNIQNKYNLSLTQRKPIVIFLDGKDITKSFEFDLISEEKGSFNDAFEQTIKEISKKMGCIAIFGVDEVSFIFEDGLQLSKCVSTKKMRTHEIVSSFSQNFYKCFKDKYKNGTVYWHCKCSNIPKTKLKSYIKFRSITIHETMLTYFLKRQNIKNSGKIALNDKIKMCEQIPYYQNIKHMEKGRLYVAGEYVELTTYLEQE